VRSGIHHPLHERPDPPSGGVSPRMPDRRRAVATMWRWPSQQELGLTGRRRARQRAEKKLISDGMEKNPGNDTKIGRSWALSRPAGHDFETSIDHGFGCSARVLINEDRETRSTPQSPFAHHAGHPGGVSAPASWKSAHFTERFSSQDSPGLKGQAAVAQLFAGRSAITDQVLWGARSLWRCFGSNSGSVAAPTFG